MTSGGPYINLANNGSSDQLLLAKGLLQDRLKNVVALRSNMGTDAHATVDDIEQTHVVFTSATFKPYCSIAMEYAKARVGAGSPALGGGCSFDIQQSGDFFSDMVGRQTLAAVSSSEMLVPTKGTITDGAFARRAIYPNDGMDWDNVTALAGATYSLVDPFGQAVADGNGTLKYRNLVHYCEYPGDRIYENVRFTLNGQTMDEYFSDTVVMLRHFMVTHDQLRGYKRLVGQEIEYEGYGQLHIGTVHDNHQTTLTAVKNSAMDIPKDNTELVTHTPNKYIGSFFPDNSANMDLAGSTTAQVTKPSRTAVIRHKLTAVGGPQTPKYWQPPLELWHKLRFWFNENPQLAVPSSAIPYGQRRVLVTYCSKNNLVYEFPGLFVKQVIDTPRATNAGQRRVAYRPFWVAGKVGVPGMDEVELYINNFFVQAELHVMFMSRVTFSLVRVYKRQVTRVTTTDRGQLKINELRLPVEYVFMGMRPSWNQDTNNPNAHRDWHRFSRAVEVDIENSAYNSVYSSVSIGGGTMASGDTINRVSPLMPDKFIVELPTINTLSFRSHGISLYDGFGETFFNAYIPLHFGRKCMSPPRDVGVLFLNFSLFPGEYQPSGHLNFSRAREFNIEWTTDYVTPETPADLVCIGIAMNFFLVTDGAGVMRYST